SDMVRETPRTEEDESTRAINGIIPTGDDMIKILSLEALLPAKLATAA
ncbi:chemotaxis protein CheW, partial [Halomonas litopenaei]|nr:chemotaxis protein CheW [Halomonas litopenaei]